MELTWGRGAGRCGFAGMLSCQQAQNVIDGKKRIILNPVGLSVGILLFFV